MQNCENLRCQPPPSWISQNADNFCVDWAIWLQFELHISRHNINWNMSSKYKILKIQLLAVDEVQKQQILMQKTQQFIESVKGVTVTRVKQQIFFTNEQSLMTVGTMGALTRQFNLIQWEIDAAVHALKNVHAYQFEQCQQASIDVRMSN